MHISKILVGVLIKWLYEMHGATMKKVDFKFVPIPSLLFSVLWIHEQNLQDFNQILLEYIKEKKYSQ